MVSARLSKFKKDISFSSMTRAYIEGLNGQPKEVPQVISQLILKTRNAGFKPKKKYFDSRGNFILPALENRQTLAQNETSDFLAATRTILTTNNLARTTSQVTWSGGGNTSDDAQRSIFKMSRSFDGGSGGCERFIGAVSWPEAPGPTKTLVIEAKEMIQPGSRPEDLNPTVELGQYHARFLYWSQGPHYYKINDVGQIGGKKYQFRARFQGEDTLEFDTLNSGERNEVLQYQAWTLGQLHKKSLGAESSSYLKAIEKYDIKEDWNESASVLSERIEALYIDYQKNKGP